MQERDALTSPGCWLGSTWHTGHTLKESKVRPLIPIARRIGVGDAGPSQGGEVMPAPNNSEASMARINGILIRGAIVVAVAAVTVLPLLR